MKRHKKTKLEIPPVKRTYLIQRLKQPISFQIGGKRVDNPFSFGGGRKNGGLSDKAMDLLRDIFLFDYMGAAEFEWGAVPKAIQFLAMCSADGQIVAFAIDLGNDETVYCLSPSPYKDDAEERIRMLRKDEYSIEKKEWCGLQRAFEEEETARSVVGWLELDNGFAFFKDKDMFLGFCKLMGVEYK